MARKGQAGFEMQAWGTTDAWQTVTAAGGAGATTVISPARVSGRSGRLLAASAGTLVSRMNIYSSNQVTVCAARIYLYIVTLPAANTMIMEVLNVSNVHKSGIQLNTDGTLGLYKTDGTQVGSNSAAMPSNTWIRIELKHDATTTPGALEGRYAVCDGSGVDPGNGSETVFASGANSDQGVWGRFTIGSSVSTTLELNFDDIAFNDSSGSQQTGYPGSGHLILQQPSAAGDSNQWLNTTGGAGASTNSNLVDEPIVNTTDFIESNTLNDSDFYNVANFGLSSTDTINVVEVVARYRNETTADAVTAFKLQLEKTASGTVVQSAAIIPNATSFASSNANIVAAVDLKTHLDPDGAAWTNTTLDSMQFGAQLTAVGTTRIQITTMWAYVDYTPAAATTTSTSSSISTSSTSQSTSTSVSTSTTVSATTSTSSTSSSISTSSTSASTSISTSSTSQSTSISTSQSTSTSSTSQSTSISTSSTSQSTSISTSSTSKSTSTSSTSASTSISTSSTSQSTSTSVSTSTTVSITTSTSSTSSSISTSSTSQSTSISTSSTSSSISTSTTVSATTTSTSQSTSTSSTSSSISTSSTSSSTSKSTSTSSTSTSLSTSTSSTSASTSLSTSTSSTSQSTSTTVSTTTSTSSTSSSISTSTSVSTSTSSTSSSTSTSVSTSSTSQSTSTSKSTSTSSTSRSTSTSSTSASTSTSTTILDINISPRVSIPATPLRFAIRRAKIAIVRMKGRV